MKAVPLAELCLVIRLSLHQCIYSTTGDTILRKRLSTTHNCNMVELSRKQKRKGSLQLCQIEAISRMCVKVSTRHKTDICIQGNDPARRELDKYSSLYMGTTWSQSDEISTPRTCQRLQCVLWFCERINKKINGIVKQVNNYRSWKMYRNNADFVSSPLALRLPFDS